MRDIASHYNNSDNDIIRKRLTHYDKYQTSLNKAYWFEFFVSVSKYSNTGSSVKTSRPIESHSMKFTPGDRPNNDWQSIGALYSKSLAVSLVRVHADHRPIVDVVFDPVPECIRH